MPGDLTLGRCFASSLAVALLATGCASAEPSGSGSRADGSNNSPASASTSPSAANGAEGGVIMGRYVVRRAPHTQAHGIAGQLIGLFSSTPHPAGGAAVGRVATTLTRPDGRFRFDRVPTGRWFVRPVHNLSPWHAQSRQIRVTASTRATVTVVACYECFSRLDRSGVR
jgi:hypothetical protein